MPVYNVIGHSAMPVYNVIGHSAMPVYNVIGHSACLNKSNRKNTSRNNPI
jgi:hypothetical protein